MKYTCNRGKGSFNVQANSGHVLYAPEGPRDTKVLLREAPESVPSLPKASDRRGRSGYDPLPAEVAAAKLNKAKKTLHDAQLLRIPPGADDKLILQWNALLISGWIWCYRATADEKYLRLATDLWHALNEQLCSGGKWYRNLTSGQLGAPAFLDDLAALAGLGSAVEAGPFVSPVRDFYLTNPIARASAVMAECSAIARDRLGAEAAE